MFNVPSNCLEVRLVPARAVEFRRNSTIMSFEYVPSRMEWQMDSRCHSPGLAGSGIRSGTRDEAGSVRASCSSRRPSQWTHQLVGASLISSLCGRRSGAPNSHRRPVHSRATRATCFFRAHFEPISSRTNSIATGRAHCCTSDPSRRLEASSGWPLLEGAQSLEIDKSAAADWP